MPPTLALQSLAAGILLLCILSAPLAIALLLFAGHWWSNRPLRRAARLDYRMCRRCHYDLRAVEEPGPCPECGLPFNLNKLKAQWRDPWSKEAE